VNPIGFKIALELYVKCQCAGVADIPFSFGVRTAGESKLSGTVIVRYVQQLVQLYMYRMPAQFVLFILFCVFIAFKILFGMKALLF
jgi:dolichol-phosphate mannosyltransferase